MLQAHRGSFLSTIRFGDELELDATAYELRRGGRAVRLERIPMEILLLLVERRDELVTREQIVERVWGKGVHVETDNAINVAMRKIRTALRDDSENPRYIRTVTAKGYRFVAEVVASPQPVLAAPPPSPVRPRSAGWIAATVAVAILAVSGIYLFRSKPAPADAAFAPAERVILAVLPFENLTGDPEQEYFSDGLTEEMIGRLGNLAPDKLAVIARTSVMRYKRDPAPLSKVGDDLHVQYVLEGSVRRDPQRVRITTQLVRVSDQTHVWARQYDRDPADLLRVQDEIADAIAREIRITLAASPSPSPLTPDEYEAYDLYLEGRHAWSERTPDGFRRGIALFERAIEKRPGDARAYAGLADCYALTASWGFAPAAEVIPKAKEAALTALKLDERLAAAHTSLALIHETYDRDWAAAETRFRRAIQLDPNYVTAHHWYAEHLGFMGRFDEALAEIERARQLDPLSLIVAADRGAILYFAKRYDEAIEQFSVVLEKDPKLGRARLIIPAYVLAGHPDRAYANLEDLRKIEHGPWVPAWATYVHGRAGRLEEARRAFREIGPLVERFAPDPTWMFAVGHLGLGENDAAIARFEKACVDRSSALIALKVDPIFDPLRGDPRFAELLRCAGF